LKDLIIWAIYVVGIISFPKSFWILTLMLVVSYPIRIMLYYHDKHEA
jgi:hypothetical protein